MSGRVVAISGAAGSLGPTVARAFLDAGATLALAGRREESLVTLLHSLGDPGGKCLATGVDLTDAAAARGWARLVVEKLGRVDVVLHLVGGYKAVTSIAEIADADWDSLHDLLVRTTLNVARAFVGPLKEGGRGRFIGVTAPRVLAPTSKSALYAMGQAASDALVMAMADELRGTGATANLIMVNSIDAPGKPYGKTTPAEEIAAAMLFLCSEQAATINGVRLPMIGRGQAAP